VSLSQIILLLNRMPDRLSEQVPFKRDKNSKVLPTQDVLLVVLHQRVSASYHNNMHNST
jgi:hypothetical protein